jgi:hypothetical protein
MLLLNATACCRRTKVLPEDQHEGVIAMERGDERQADANNEKEDGAAELVPEEEMETLCRVTSFRTRSTE